MMILLVVGKAPYGGIKSYDDSSMDGRADGCILAPHCSVCLSVAFCVLYVQEGGMLWSLDPPKISASVR
jgi:hypothetical protein